MSVQEGQTLKQLKERIQQRRQLLTQHLGITNTEDLGLSLGREKKRTISQSEDEGTPQTEIETSNKKLKEASSPVEKNVKKEMFQSEISTYVDSSAFLKGTQSHNPHNDYCQHFVSTGQRPQNFIRDVGLADRFEEYPKLKELIRLKDERIAQTATPPMYLKADLMTLDFRQLQCEFDVILVEPPLEEYQKRYGLPTEAGRFWSWEDIMRLEVSAVAAPRSFVFLWCGSSDGLDLGRQCLKKWGFRRSEDFCWIKTNIKKPSRSNKTLENRAIFQRTKEHCLMGIKGTVRRSVDGDFIHANVDIDLIISEEPEYGSLEKPEEMFHIIEHFCLGRRRLHLFGRDSTLRPGWLTVGPELTNSNFSADAYSSYFNKNPTDYLTGSTDRIESLRPKSPPPTGRNAGGGRGFRGGRGAHRGR